MKLALKSRVNAAGKAAARRIKGMKDKGIEKAKGVDWKRVGKVALKVGWELTKLGVNIAVDLTH